MDLNRTDLPTLQALGAVTKAALEGASMQAQGRPFECGIEVDDGIVSAVFSTPIALPEPQE